MKLGEAEAAIDLKRCRDNWESELDDGYTHATTTASLDTDLSLSLAVTL